MPTKGNRGAGGSDEGTPSSSELAADDTLASGANETATSARRAHAVPIGSAETYAANAESSGAGEKAKKSATDAWVEPAVGVVLGRYRLTELLGRGGMGQVWRATDLELERDVALKFLDSSGEGSTGAHKRMLREAQAPAQLSHPNVVSVFDVGSTHTEAVWLAMELIEGKSGDAWAGESPAWRTVLSVYRQVGEGLEVAHAAGLVHRDFKPSNFIVGDDGWPRVLDFGLVGRSNHGDPERTKTPSALEMHLTQHGSVLGTPMYMSPEQMMGDALDAKSDQFSFAVSLWEALHGSHPFPAEKFSELRVRASECDYEPPANSDVPQKVQNALLRALSPDPDLRFDSMKELLRALSIPKKRWPAFVAATAVVASLSVAAYGALSSDASSRCSDLGDQARDVWPAQRAQSVKDSFRATELGFAADSFAAVDKNLRERLANWTMRRQQVCRDTHEHGTQSAQLLDLRMECLDRQLAQVRAFAQALTSVDAAGVRAAPRGAAKMPDPSLCLASAERRRTRGQGPGAARPV